MSTADKLNKILETKVAIKDAIEKKGVTVGNVKFADYAKKVGDISSGGASVVEGSGDISIRFFDPIYGHFHTILCNEGDTVDVSHIEAIEHSDLELERWVSTTEIIDGKISDIYRDIDVGANFTTKSGSIEIEYTIYDDGANLAVKLISENPIRVVWGDGQISTAHTDNIYTASNIAKGKYKMIIEYQDSITFDKANSQTLGDAKYDVCIDSVKFGRGVTAVPNLFKSNSSINTIIFSDVIATDGITEGAMAIKYLICPHPKLTRSCARANNGVVRIVGAFDADLTNAIYEGSIPDIILPEKFSSISSFFQSGKGALKLTIPKGKMPNGLRFNQAIQEVICYDHFNIYDLLFDGCVNLLYVESTTTNIGQYAMRGCSKMQYLKLLHTAGVVSLTSTNALQGVTAKIYVPQNLVKDYKTATNWSVFSEQIFGY